VDMHWSFEPYETDVLIINAGTNDYFSFFWNEKVYNISSATFSQRYMATYVYLIQKIRRIAYPHAVIYVMRPFNGMMEHETRWVVDRLRNEGDKRVYWVDTSHWLVDASDFAPDLLHPNDEGNKKIAEYMSGRVCVLLAGDGVKCPEWVEPTELRMLGRPKAA